MALTEAGEEVRVAPVMRLDSDAAHPFGPLSEGCATCAAAPVRKRVRTQGRQINQTLSVRKTDNASKVSRGSACVSS